VRRWNNDLEVDSRVYTGSSRLIWNGLKDQEKHLHYMIQIPHIAKLISYTETRNGMYHTFRNDVPEFRLFKTGGRQNSHELFER